MRRSLALLVVLLSTLPPSSAIAQKGGGLPAPPKLADNHAKLAELIAGLVKKEDARVASLLDDLKKTSAKLAEPTRQALGKAGADVETARLDLESAKKEVDAAVRSQRLAAALAKHASKLSAAQGAARPVLGPALASLPRFTPQGAPPPPLGGWTYVGTPPAAPGGSYVYERNFLSSSTDGNVARVEQDRSLVHAYVNASWLYDDKLARGGFEQSFTVPAGIKSIEVAATILIQAKGGTLAAFGYDYAEVRALLAASGPDGQCSVDHQVWEHIGLVIDVFSGDVGGTSLDLICTLNRQDATVAGTYAISAGVTHRAGVGANAFSTVDSDGVASGSVSGGLRQVRVDGLRWRPASP